MKRPEAGTGLFYSRDSGGKHENSLRSYLDWARREAQQLGVSFDPPSDVLDVILANKQTSHGDVFLDYGISGNILVRKALTELRQRLVSDPNISHVFIPRRDRLARPGDAIQGVQLETDLRQLGVALIFMDAVAPPMRLGQRRDLVEGLQTYLAYDKSGRDRRDLAEKILAAQVQLAKGGYSIGGRPSYGFRRWLVRSDGTRVRELQDGERVRMAGHHVIWLPGPENELRVIFRILEMLERMPANRVAAQLTREGVPTPDADRLRTDRGVLHHTSGVWHATTITNIARNRLLCAVVVTGRRSMGDQLRFSPTGKRELEDSDFRLSNDTSTKPKTVANPKSLQVTAKAPFSPLVDVDRHQALISELDKRGSTQRGKPRSRDPLKNPLGGRLFDLACGWPMYRVPVKASFDYRCGAYMQSHGVLCNHNHIDGPKAVQWLLSCIRQRLLSPPVIVKLQDRLRELAQQELNDRRLENGLAKNRARLAQLESEIQLLQKNLGRAQSDEDHAAIARELKDLRQERKQAEQVVATLQQSARSTNDAHSEVTAALVLLDHLVELLDDGQEGLVNDIFALTNAKLFLGFEPTQLKKRTVNKLARGIATFGTAEPPIELYAGPTDRKKLLAHGADCSTIDHDHATTNLNESFFSGGGREKSLGNVNRGDRI